MSGFGVGLEMGRLWDRVLGVLGRFQNDEAVGGLFARGGFKLMVWCVMMVVLGALGAWAVWLGHFGWGLGWRMFCGVL